MREAQGIVLLAVADGVGGGPGGDIAADAAVQELAARFFAGTGSIEERMADAFRDANTAVLRAADTSGKPMAASTLVAVGVQGGRAVIANLGDSRAYLVRVGTARQLTHDHSGDIAHGITRFVGDERGVQPDVFVEDLAPGDRLLLCSDGLTRHVSDEEIAMTVAGAMRLATRVTDAPRAAPPDLEGAAESLVGLANSRGGEDNITVALYAEQRAGVGSPSRRAVGLVIFVAFVTLVVTATIALLISLAPYAPASGPSASPTASASATPSPTPSPSPSRSPTPTEPPTPTPTP